MKLPISPATGGTRIGGLLAAAVIAGLVLPFAIDTDRRTTLELQYFASQGRWSDLLRLAAREGIGTCEDQCLVDRALYHQGRLGYDLFVFPQPWNENGLILDHQRAFAAPMLQSDLFWELGCVDLAENWAHEALTVRGETLSVLKRCAQIALVKNERSMARGFLAALSRGIAYRRWAIGHARYLDSADCIGPDIELAQVRSVNPSADFLTDIGNPRKTLTSMLDRNPHNNAAYEYLMAYALLGCRTALVADNVGGLCNFGYREIPPLYEEALLVNAATNRIRAVAPPCHGISDAAFERFGEFNRSVATARGNLPACRPALEKSFPSTYWFYNLYLHPESSGRKEDAGEPMPWRGE